MQFLFIIVCIAVIIGLFKIASSITSARVADIVTKLYWALCAVLFIVGLYLIFANETFEYMKPEQCGFCGGDGINVLNGKKCFVCDGAGGAIITSSTSSIPLIYPIGLWIVAIFAFFAGVCCGPSAPESCETGSAKATLGTKESPSSVQNKSFKTPTNTNAKKWICSRCQTANFGDHGQCKNCGKFKG